MASGHDDLAVVTGAGGFIGSHLVEALLRAGWRVRALVHYNALGSEGHLAAVRAHLQPAEAARLAVVAGDVTDARCVAELVRGAAVVFHLAALIGIPYSYVAPQSYVQVNITGTLNVLEACRNGAVPRLVHTSTSEVYGSAQRVPMDEAHPLQGQSPYSATKIGADKLVESYTLSFGLPAVTIRPFNTYGPRQSLRAVIPTILAQALAPECREVRLGALSPVRDMTFATDTAAAFLRAAQVPMAGLQGRVLNLGTGLGFSVGEIAGTALRLLGIDKPIVCEEERLRPEGSEVQRLISDNRAARAALGWEPAVSLEEGLLSTAAWVRTHAAQLRPTEYRR